MSGKKIITFDSRNFMVGMINCVMAVSMSAIASQPAAVLGGAVALWTVELAVNHAEELKAGVAFLAKSGNHS